MIRTVLALWVTMETVVIVCSRPYNQLNFWSAAPWAKLWAYRQELFLGTIKTLSYWKAHRFMVVPVLHDPHLWQHSWRPKTCFLNAWKYSKPTIDYLNPN